MWTQAELKTVNLTKPGFGAWEALTLQEDREKPSKDKIRYNKP